MKRNYGYRLIGSWTMDNNSGCSTLKQLQHHVAKIFGTPTQFEYWSSCGNFSGEAYAKYKS